MKTGIFKGAKTKNKLTFGLKLIIFYIFIFVFSSTMIMIFSDYSKPVKTIMFIYTSLFFIIGSGLIRFNYKARIGAIIFLMITVILEMGAFALLGNSIRLIWVIFLSLGIYYLSRAKIKKMYLNQTEKKK